jgi:3-dehydroquinate synthase
MQSLCINGALGPSTLWVGERLENLSQYTKGRNTIIITDTHTADLYGHLLSTFPTITIGVGEGIKTIDTLKIIYDQLVQREADRSTLIVGIGGGIVCDITGFAASTFMRGVNFGFVASTLLAQVDASVGGKNGVNFGGYKNMVGVFNQPEFVICDMTLLKTLPKDELLCGMSEIVKHAAIADENMFTFLEKEGVNALKLDLDVIEHLVFESVKIKATVVNQDEKEKGNRRLLNFGHTLGHALEKTTGIPHGQAVSIGMLAATEMSVRKGLLPSAAAKRMKDLLVRLELPITSIGKREDILSAIRKDKKREGAEIFFILLKALGQAVVTPLRMEELDQLSQDLF